MDLGIKGKKGIVGGASSGLGRACALALAREGVELTIVARTKAGIEAAAEELSSETRVRIIPVAADINSDDGRAAVLSTCPEPDIIVNLVNPLNLAICVLTSAAIRLGSSQGKTC